MALTHAQRTSMFNTLAEVMGSEDAETLMEHLPSSGWDNVATKDDLRAGFAETNSAIAAGLAQAAVERAEIRAEAATGLAQAATERTQIIKAMTEGFAQAAVERAEIRAEAATGLAQAATERTQIIKAMTEGFAQAAVERAEIRAEAATERAEIRAEAATERAEIIKRQAWHLYIVVSTIVVATVSIWIALVAQPGPG